MAIHRNPCGSQSLVGRATRITPASHGRRALAEIGKLTISGRRWNYYESRIRKYDRSSGTHCVTGPIAQHTTTVSDYLPRILHRNLSCNACHTCSMPELPSRGVAEPIQLARSEPGTAQRPSSSRSSSTVSTIPVGRSAASSPASATPQVTAIDAMPAAFAACMSTTASPT